MTPSCVCGRALDAWPISAFNYRISVVDGENETSTHQITCTGMSAGDQVIAVLVLTTKASIATLAAHAGTFLCATDKIVPGTEANNTSNQYVIFWLDLT